MSRSHNELSQVTITANPRDLQNNPYSPTTARYRVDDCESKTELIGWTSIATPSSAMEIVIPGSANKIIRSQRNPESKVLTVNTDEGLSTQHYEEYIYRVKDLKFVS